MNSRLVLVLVVVASQIPSVARATKPGCQATLTGSVQAKFDCLVRVRIVDTANAVMEIFATKEIEGIPSVLPGSFLVGRPLGKGTFTFDHGLGEGRATVAADGGTLFIASKTFSNRGEVTLTITSVTGGKDGAEVIHGSYRARLIPSGAGKKGEVIVEVKF